MRVILLGGDGHVGEHLVRALVSAGHEAVVFSCGVHDGAERLPSGIPLTAWDPVAEPGRLANLLIRASAVVDVMSAEALAGTPAGAHDGVVAERALIDALAAVPSMERPGVLLGFSRADIYADDAAIPAAEEAALAESAVAAHASRIERNIAAAEALDMRAVCLRLGSVICRGVPIAPALELPNEPDAEHRWLTWIAVDDLCRLVLRALTGWDVNGPVNAVAPQIVARDTRYRGFMTARRPVWPAAALRAGFEFRHRRLGEADSGALRVLTPAATGVPVRS